jgi:transglutaminase-like putative cysteine protease
MTTYDVRQSTAYTYASPVPYAHHALRLTPIDRNGQRVHAASLDIVPAPVERRDGFDFFGNRMTWITIDESHETFTVKVSARIAVEPPVDPATLVTPAWEEVRDAAFASDDLTPESPVHGLFASRQVPLDPEIRTYAQPSFPAGRPVLDGVIELTRRIKVDFVYEVGATNVRTTPSMSFALRRGVCQDFAHIMISGLRGLGIPARYVSGYLRTYAAPGKKKLEGADAMHAWVSVWCGPEVGWHGVDPTNGIHAGEDHVVLALGRDYADVAPIDGVVFASGRQKLKVGVSVTAVDEG